jgi:hypothetical protein
MIVALNVKIMPSNALLVPKVMRLVILKLTIMYVFAMIRRYVCLFAHIICICIKTVVCYNVLMEHIRRKIIL